MYDVCRLEERTRCPSELKRPIMDTHKEARSGIFFIAGRDERGHSINQKYVVVVELHRMGQGDIIQPSKREGRLSKLVTLAQLRGHSRACRLFFADAVLTNRAMSANPGNVAPGKMNAQRGFKCCQPLLLGSSPVSILPHLATVWSEYESNSLYHE